jgi:hypothetical protein
MVTTRRTVTSDPAGPPRASVDGVTAPARFAPPVVAPTRGRRRPALLVAGATVTLVGALVAVWLVNAAAHRVPVLVVARPVAAGSTIATADLSRAEVSVDSGVATVPASELDGIVGRVAGSDLVPGALLAPGQVTDEGPPRAGQVLVVLALPSARMPAGGLHPGDPVLVVDTPPADADPPASPPATIPATVVRVGGPDLNGVTAVDVSVAVGDGPALAARAATGRIAVVVQHRARG